MVGTWCKGGVWEHVPLFHNGNNACRRLHDANCISAIDNGRRLSSTLPNLLQLRDLIIIFTYAMMLWVSAFPHPTSFGCDLWAVGECGDR